MLFMILATPMSVLAKSNDKVAYMTQEEMEQEVWEEFCNENYYENDSSFFYSLSLSIARNEYVKFIKEYKPLNSDVTVARVSSEYYGYLYNDLYSNIEFDQDSDGKYYEYNTDKPDDKRYWTYNEDTKKFICRNANDKVVKTYDRYYIPTEQEASSDSQKATENVEETESITAPTQALQQAQEARPKPAGAVQTATQPTEQLSESTDRTVEAVAVEPQEQGSTSPVITVILCIMGCVIVALAIAIIYKLKKTK